MIPTTVVSHFLDDYERNGKYTGERECSLVGDMNISCNVIKIVENFRFPFPWNIIAKIRESSFTGMPESAIQ